MNQLSLRKIFTGVLSAALIAVSPGVQGYQAFAQFNASIKISQVRLAPMAPRSMAVLPRVSPQMQVSQAMTAMAKDLAEPLKAAAAGRSPRASGGEIQDVMEGGRSVKASRGASFVDASGARVSVEPTGLLPAGPRAGRAVQEPKAAAAAAAARSGESSFVGKVFSTLRKAGARAVLAAAMAVLGTAGPALAGSVNPIYAAISPFKLGFYGPVKDAPIFGWFYVGANVWSQKETAENKHPLGVEVGFTMEPIKRSMNFFGVRGVETVYKPAYLAGIKYHLNADLDMSAGGKYSDGKPGGYFSVSFKFSSLYGAQKKIADGTYDTERYIRQYGTRYDLEQYLREIGR